MKEAGDSTRQTRSGYKTYVVDVWAVVEKFFVSSRQDQKVVNVVLDSKVLKMGLT